MRGQHKIILAVAFAFVGFGLWPIAARSDGIAGHNRVTRDRCTVAAATITHTTAGTADTCMTTTKESSQIGFENTTDKEVTVTLAGVAFKIVPAGAYRVLDLHTDGVAIAPGVWGVYAASTPGSGVLEIVSLPYR